MSFLKLIFKNPFRNKSRAMLSILGIGIGIVTIIALGSITSGLIAGAEDSLHAGGSDFMIMGKDEDSALSSNSPISSDWISKINIIPGVNQTIGMFSDTTPYSDGNYLYYNGVDPKYISVLDLKITKGANFKEGEKEVIMGKLCAERLNKTVNDKIKINNTDLKIVGIYESGNPTMDQDIFTSIAIAQNISGKYGNISGIFVKVDKGADVETVVKSIEKKYKNNVSIIKSIADLEESKEIINTINGAKWGISLLAILVGGIGIINTMIMSVYERTREIGVLKAVGWSSSRILGMIVSESIIITLLSGIVGSICGVILVETIAIVGILEGINPVFSASIFLEAIAISLIVGIIGGLYPAIKASKLPPTEALRYE